MKKSVFWILSGLVWLTANTVWAEQNPWERKLPFKTATISYSVSGTMTGTKTIYVKDFGGTSAEYSTTTMKMFGMTQDQKDIEITTPDWIYSADLVEHTGSKQANIRKYMIEEFNRLSAGDRKKVLKNIETLGISTVEGMSGSVEKKAATIRGYDCDKVSMMGTTVYTITDSELPLKIEGNTMGIKVSQEVTDIKTGAAPASKFELPEGIHFEHDPDTDRMIKEQAHAAIQNLLDGKSPAVGMMQQAGQNPMANDSEIDPAVIEKMKNMFQNMQQN